MLLGYTGDRVVLPDKKEVALYWKPDCVRILDEWRLPFSPTRYLIIPRTTGSLRTVAPRPKLLSSSLSLLGSSLSYRFVDPEEWAAKVCSRTLADPKPLPAEKFSICNYVHAIKAAFVRHNHDAFDEAWKIYPDLEQLLARYGWTLKPTTLTTFLQKHKPHFQLAG